MRSYEDVRPLSIDWYRASFCQSGECVEVARHDDTVMMRNSTHPDTGYVYFTPEEFNMFLGAAKAGEFDLIN
jgi:nitrate reductase alpha subunit